MLCILNLLFYQVSPNVQCAVFSGKSCSLDDARFYIFPEVD